MNNEARRTLKTLRSSSFWIHGRRGMAYSERIYTKQIMERMNELGISDSFSLLIQLCHRFI